MKSIAEMEADAESRVARTRTLTIACIATFLFGAVVGRLSDSSSTDQTSAQPSEPTLISRTAPLSAPPKTSGKIGAKDVEDMAIGAMLLDRFDDAAKLLNLLREDYPKSHEARSLRELRLLLHKEISSDKPYTSSDCRELRTLLDAARKLRADYPLLPPDRQRLAVALLGPSFFEPGAVTNVDALLDSARSLETATEKAKRGE